MNAGHVRVNLFAYLTCFDYLDENMEDDRNNYDGTFRFEQLEDDEDNIVASNFNEWDLVQSDTLLNLDFLHME